MTTRTISDDVPGLVDEASAPSGDEDIDGAAEALLARWEKKDASKTPSGSAKKEATGRAQQTETEEHETDTSEDQFQEVEETEGDHENGETEGEGNGKDAAEEQAETQLAGDDHEVEVNVDGEARRVSIKDLKRLYGQEASLTRKSQEVASQRQAAETEGKRHTEALQRLLKRAEERWKPFSDIDFLTASKNMDAEQFTQLRAAAQTAYQDVAFFKNELDAAVKETSDASQKQFRERADECIKVLSSKPEEGGIEGWGPQLYGELRTYATKNGLAERGFNQLVDPAAFRMIHKAYLYDKAQKVAVKKVATAPKNVVGKTKTNGTGSTPARNAQRGAMEKLRKSGNPDDAAEAFMSRWNVRDDG